MTHVTFTFSLFVPCPCPVPDLPWPINWRQCVCTWDFALFSLMQLQLCLHTAVRKRVCICVNASECISVFVCSDSRDRITHLKKLIVHRKCFDSLQWVMSWLWVKLNFWVNRNNIYKCKCILNLKYATIIEIIPIYELFYAIYKTFIIIIDAFNLKITSSVFRTKFLIIATAVLHRWLTNWH